jgi:soluble lytic murein transglycosylase-like protein
MAAAEDEYAAEVSVLLGLYAHTCGRLSASLEYLQNADTYVGEIADWRLSTLAASALELGQLETAQSALATLVTKFPESPLRERSLVGAAELAYERGDLVQALELFTEDRKNDFSEELGARLETVGWKLAIALEDRDLERSVARQLLVHHPSAAAQLEVAEIFRSENGELDWNSFLSGTELKTRARSLMALDLAPQAVELLESLDEAARDLEWLLLTAEALTVDHRGSEALVTLAQVERQPPADEVVVEWQRAQAALEASHARRGRQLSSEDRRTMRQRAHEHLRLLLGLGPEPEPGARHLWSKGWREYDRRNASGAIGYWTELVGLYPESSYSRAGLYWSARAHQRLGNHKRAQEILRQVVHAGFDDFYRQHALRALGEEVGSAVPARHAEQKQWPLDSTLERARFLAAAGLDETALTELDLVGRRAEQAATDALRARILANQGKRRESIIALRRAFPELGTPGEFRAPALARRLYYPLAYSDIIESNAERQELSAFLVFGMIRQESAFDPSARSWAGARGLMQVMPATGRELARRLGLSYSRDRLADPAFSVQLGTAYLRQVMRMFDDNEQLALAGYNAGPYRIKRLWAKAGAQPELDSFLEGLPLDETRTYVKRVLLYSNSYRNLYADQG